MLCGNLRRRDGTRPLPGSLVLERPGPRVGVVAVSVAMVTERMRTQAASAFLWDPPIESCVVAARELRPHVDLLIALTHIGYPQDRKLAERCPEVDVILGGHSHTVLHQPEQVGRTWIAQTGSHGRFVGRWSWDQGRLGGELMPWS